MSKDTVLTVHELELPESPSQTISCLTSTRPHELYESLPLPTNIPSIRLLDLQAINGQSDNVSDYNSLTGSLRVAQLEKSLPFVALSYVCGKDTSNAHTLFCVPQCCILPITPNCSAALHRIQKQYGPIAIWVDSVCINQADDAEKSAQIPLMQQIYSWAETVYVWLGEGDPQSNEAMRYLRAQARSKARLPLQWLVASLLKPDAKEVERSRFRREALKDPIRECLLRRALLLYKLDEQ